MCTDFRALLDYADTEFTFGFVGLLHQPTGGGQPAGSGTDDDHVEVH